MNNHKNVMPELPRRKGILYVVWLGNIHLAIPMNIREELFNKMYMPIQATMIPLIGKDIKHDFSST